MTTIKISVGNKHDADLLYKMLQKISFVESVEKAETSKTESKSGQFRKIKKLLAEMAAPELFKNIDNPVNWQQDLRNEWE